ncbi:hydroxymethylglutaryl-CoA reductase [Pontibacter sp. G13]|uniref:hydroxymethylglutaryl-CoA reductase n=1 Tax=Pontibacter sp. G13 TaxID=3074898 RepID=UPI00288BF636|nr:hydroxymethylglutaryl-CoA reductase [Pontibacter sp. G13]WNJ16458.1 hydroxymethylglutaryl-CoA reductase [Pontibacter sp. G13]
MFVPSLLLKQLYTFGSMVNDDQCVRFSLKNRLSDATVTGIHFIQIDGKDIPLDSVQLVLENGTSLPPFEVTKQTPIDFPLKSILEIAVQMEPLEEGKYPIVIEFETKPFGKLKLKVEDAIRSDNRRPWMIPRDNHDDYSPEIIRKRQALIEEFSKKPLEHIPQYSFDPTLLRGNVEHFTGIAQIPMGFAGPIKINGEHANGSFLIPLATTEGTLVASYNRGIKLVNECGGVKCSVVEDAMQRAPVFVMKDARAVRTFVKWVKDHFKEIAEQAESTTSVGKLSYIDPYQASKFAYLRFNFTTGDAAGQNMVGRATFAACSWILDHYQANEIQHFFLESNLATDKKASQVNIMHTRGKRVTAEVVVKRELLNQYMRVDTTSLAFHNGVANIGAILSGANNNGLHSANAITAMFIATGQDVANVSESSAGIVYTNLTPDNDLYFSITIPSLIVATYGGGTGLATQRESLEVMDCYGKGKVHKLAEIIAGVVLAGELSLASAISSSDWVSSHEQYGRNR